MTSPPPPSPRIEILSSPRGYFIVVGRRRIQLPVHRRSRTLPEIYEASWYWTNDNKWSCVEHEGRVFPSQFAAETFAKMNETLLCGKLK